MNITQMLNNNCFVGRNGLKPKWLILHSTAGGTSAQAIAEYFKSTEGSNNPVSAHYVIGQDGSIYMCNKESDGAWGNGVITGIPANLPFHTVGDGIHRDAWWDPSVNPNNVTISIEHCKPSIDNSDALTPAQQASGLWLINDICTRNSIPKRYADASGGITGHFSVDPAERSFCPNTYPWQELFNYLNGGNIMSTTPQIPTGWTDDSTNKILKGPNGVPVTLGFRDWIMNHPSWNADDYPLSPEYAANPVEESNPSIGAGTAQEFRLGTRLGYTAKMGVYQTWAGQELQWYQKQYTLLQAQIATLQKQPSVANLTQINTLASQIEKLSVVQ